MGMQDFKTEKARSTRINVLWVYINLCFENNIMTLREHIYDLSFIVYSCIEVIL